MRTEVSYGIVPIIMMADGSWQVLLIEQISHRDETKSFWTFPKGHSEESEASVDTALRELEEETGITEVELKGQKTFIISYTFSHAGEEISKTVEFYLGYCMQSETKITHPEEVAAVRWCAPEEALSLLTHQNTRNVLADVMTFLAHEKNT